MPIPSLTSSSRRARRARCFYPSLVGAYTPLTSSSRRAPRQLRPLVKALAPCVLFVATRVLVRMLFRAGRRHAPSPMATDGLDNLAKAARIQGDYFVIYAKHDEMMPPHFATSLLAARYGRRNAAARRDRVIGVPGGHCSFFGDVPALSQQYRKYLTSIGFIP